MAAVAPFDTHSNLSEGERLGERIAELNAYLTVTQAHFLELLREFDEQRYWEALGFRSCTHWHFKFLQGAGHDKDRHAGERGHAAQHRPPRHRVSH